MTTATRALLKEDLALRLKQAIVEGRLRPGERVVESAWAREFGTAQASVREGINLLIAEGFLVKSAGRSARVPKYTAADLARIYEVRGGLEGLAAQLAARAKANLAPMEAELKALSAAVDQGDVREVIGRDLAFHLALADASGNPLLAEMLERLMRPLFTFVLLRMMETKEVTVRWAPDLPRYRQILYMIEGSNPATAGQFVQQCVEQFAAQAIWWPDAHQKRRKGT